MTGSFPGYSSASTRRLMSLYERLEVSGARPSAAAKIWDWNVDVGRVSGGNGDLRGRHGSFFHDAHGGRKNDCQAALVTHRVTMAAQHHTKTINDSFKQCRVMTKSRYRCIKKTRSRTTTGIRCWCRRRRSDGAIKKAARAPVFVLSFLHVALPRCADDGDGTTGHDCLCARVRPRLAWFPKIGSRWCIRDQMDRHRTCRQR